MKLDFDERFQERVVRLMYQDADFGESALTHLSSKSFENPVHAWTVKQMAQCIQLHGHMPDQLILRNERRKAEAFGTIRKEDRGAYRRFIKKLPTVVPNRTYVKKELQNFVVNQSWKSLILDAVDKHLPQKDFAELAKRANDVLDLDLTGDYSLGSRPGASFMKRVRERQKAKKRGITTGLDALDALMVQRGLVEKQLGCIIAPTGRGKTNFLINLAASAVMRNVPTLYITLELDEDTINTRFDARITGVSLKALKRERRTVIQEWKKHRKKVRRNLVVKEMSPDSTVAQIRHHIKRLERRGFYPKLVVIDYADLLQPSFQYTDNAYESQGQVYRDLIRLLKDLRIVCWTATQGNRKSMDKKDTKGEVDMSMMAESVKKAFLAYVVLGIAQSEKEKRLKRGRIMVLKNRNGASDRALPVRIQHDVVKFRTVSAEA